MLDRARAQARADQLEVRARRLKSEIRAKRQELVDVKTEQARLLGIRITTKPRSTGHSDHASSEATQDQTAA